MIRIRGITPVFTHRLRTSVTIQFKSNRYVTRIHPDISVSVDIIVINLRGNHGINQDTPFYRSCSRRYLRLLGYRVVVWTLQQEGVYTNVHYVLVD